MKSSDKRAMVRLNLLLLALLTACALGLVTSQHKARKLFVELEQEQERARKKAKKLVKQQVGEQPETEQEQREQHQTQRALQEAKQLEKRPVQEARPQQDDAGRLEEAAAQRKLLALFGRSPVCAPCLCGGPPHPRP